MKKTLMTTLVTTALLAGSAIVADARPGDEQRVHRNKGDRGAKAMMRCLRAADLDDAQKEQVEALLESSKETTKSLREDARNARKAVKEGLDAGVSDSELGALTRAAHEAAEAVRSNREQTKDAIAAILTEEQQLRFEGCASAMRGRRGK